MKRPHCYWLAALLLLMCTGCGTQLALTGQEWDDYLKAIKPYSAHWVKPGVMAEERRRDWVACGGGSDGSYGYEKKAGMSNQEFFSGFEQHAAKVSICMRKSGYQFEK